MYALACLSVQGLGFRARDTLPVGFMMFAAVEAAVLCCAFSKRL